MRTIIWNEMSDMKLGEIYLTLYIEFHNNLAKIISIITLIVSMSGILSWNFFEKYVWIALALIALMQIVILIQDKIIRSKKDVDKIVNLKKLYTSYFFALEKMWNKIKNEETFSQKMTDEFFELKKTHFEKIENQNSKLNIKDLFFIKHRAEKLTNNYITKFF